MVGGYPVTTGFSRNYVPDTSLTDLHLRLSRLMVVESYYNNVYLLGKKGKKKKVEGSEDKSQIGAFILECSSVPEMFKYLKGKSFIHKKNEETVPYGHNGDMEAHIMECSDRADGAMLIDNERMSKEFHIVFDGLLTEATREFASKHVEDAEVFDDVYPFFVHEKFSHYKGGALHLGSKSQNFVASSFVVPKSKSHLIKYTAFGNVGTGKVIEMKRVKEGGGDTVYYRELFLFLKSDLPELTGDDFADSVESAHLFDPEKGVVCVSQNFAADYRKPKLELIERKLLKPENLKINRDKLLV